MAESGSYGIFTKPMSVSDFRRLSEFIHTQCGIKMTSAKKIMIAARLQKRLRSLEIDSFRDYCDHLFSDPGGKGEVVHRVI